MSQVEAVRAIVLEALGEEEKAWDFPHLLATLALNGISDVSRGQLNALLTKMAIEGITERVEYGVWKLSKPPLLTWEKPPRRQSYEEWAQYQADSAPPGAYAPNMSDEWKLRWKAKMLGQKGGELRVEIRKTVAGNYGDSAQVLIVAYEDGSVRTSMNGKAGWSEREWAELPRAVDEARKAMRTWRDGQLARSIQLPGPSREQVEDMKGHEA